MPPRRQLCSGSRVAMECVRQRMHLQGTEVAALLRKIILLDLIAMFLRFSISRSAGAVLRQLGHEATDVRDIGMRDAPGDTIAAYARDNHLVLVTRDFDFADIRNYPPSLYQGVVRLKLQEDAAAKQVALLLASFAGREDWLKYLIGRLGDSGKLANTLPTSLNG